MRRFAKKIEVAGKYRFYLRGVTPKICFSKFVKGLHSKIKKNVKTVN